MLLAVPGVQPIPLLPDQDLAMKILRWLVALTEVGEPALSRPVGTAADFEYWYGESSPGREGVR